MELHQTKTFVHSEGNYQLNEKITHWMRKHAFLRDTVLYKYKIFICIMSYMHILLRVPMLLRGIGLGNGYKREKNQNVYYCIKQYVLNWDSMMKSVLWKW